MKKYRFSNEGNTWERVTKKQARAAYNSGLTILLCPAKMRPFTPWHLEAYVDNVFCDTFDSIVNGFEFYNCNSETGRYTSFYVKIGGGTV